MEKREDKDVIVIGAGAAGMLAAGQAAARGLKTLILEKNNRPGKKLSITGKGRCNLTNAAEVPELIENVVHNSKFLYSAFYSFDSHQLRNFFQKWGLPTRIERGDRVFPKSDKAEDVVQTLQKYLDENSAEIRQGQVQKVIKQKIKTPEDKCSGENNYKIIVEGDITYRAKAVIIATGGITYPETGSTGDGFKFAQNLGHSVNKPRPGLVPLETRENWVKEANFLDLRNISIKVFEEDKEIFKGFGELSFTDFGVAGPLIISASSLIERPAAGNYSVIIDLKPALTSTELDQRLQRDFDKYSRKFFGNALGDLLPVKLISVIIKLSSISYSKPVNQISKKQRHNLVNLLKNLKLNISDYKPRDRGIITVGGVNVDEINPSTMESKINDNLFFAGEIIDVDAYTGGYNLQIAFSTGFTAGNNILNDF